jgi:hypothetical protein
MIVQVHDFLTSEWMERRRIRIVYAKTRCDCSNNAEPALVVDSLQNAPVYPFVAEHHELYVD